MRNEPTQITIATWNVLANGYVRHEHFPSTPQDILAAKNRYPRIVERAASFNADVICLQEVDADLHALLRARLAADGYDGDWAQKSWRKPDGCATFVRGPWLERRLVSYSRHFHDGFGSRPDSGHVAQVTALSFRNDIIAVVNTHLKWDKPGAPISERLGFIQGEELLDMLKTMACPSVVCGDFNAEPSSATLQAFRTAGFTDSHDHSFATANHDGRAKKIDFILHDGELIAHPQPTTSIADDTPLPSETEPSDHLPLTTIFTFAADDETKVEDEPLKLDHYPGFD